MCDKILLMAGRRPYSNLHEKSIFLFGRLYRPSTNPSLKPAVSGLTQTRGNRRRPFVFFGALKPAAPRRRYSATASRIRESTSRESILNMSGATNTRMGPAAFWADALPPHNRSPIKQKARINPIQNAPRKTSLLWRLAILLPLGLMRIFRIFAQSATQTNSYIIAKSWHLKLWAYRLFTNIVMLGLKAWTCLYQFIIRESHTNVAIASKLHAI